MCKAIVTSNANLRANPESETYVTADENPETVTYDTADANKAVFRDRL